MALRTELDPEQQQVVMAVHGPVCVLAGAGTGKTRAITHRIANAVELGHHDPARTLALTFTARAAGEMRTRLRELGVNAQARTFHAAALRQLRYFWPRISGGELPRLVASKAEFVAEALRESGLSVERSLVLDVASQIEWAKVGLITPEDFMESTAERTMPAGLTNTDMARLYRNYERAKSSAGAIDFEDVLLVLLGALTEYEEIALQVRSQYRHFTVDEYQDVSPLQQRLLEAWLGESRDLCVVGDPNQTIYSFAGASPRYLREFPQKYPDAQVVSLVRDYRSTPEIVHLATRIIGGVELYGQQSSGPAPRMLEFRSDAEEADWIATEIAKLLESNPSHEIAVLFRTNGQSETYEATLAARNIPYQLRGSERFFDRAEVKDAIRLLRGASVAHTSDPDSHDLQSEVRAVLTQLGWSERPPAGPGAMREKWDSLNALVELAKDFTSLPAFVEELDERVASQHVPTLAGVTLASLHAAKGLEWEAVFLAGMRDGLVPISYATTEESIEEERRLLYVGITRARRHLALSWSGERSRFLAPIERGRSASAKPAVSTCRVCGRGLSSGAERKIGRCATCPTNLDQALFEELREWRTEQAKVASMPAFVIMTDATLIALAERRPQSHDELRLIPGIGPAKAEKYGQSLLDLLRN